MKNTPDRTHLIRPALWQNGWTLRLSYGKPEFDPAGGRYAVVFFSLSALVGPDRQARSSPSLKSPDSEAKDVKLETKTFNYMYMYCHC